MGTGWELGTGLGELGRRQDRRDPDLVGCRPHKMSGQGDGVRTWRAEHAWSQVAGFGPGFTARKNASAGRIFTHACGPGWKRA